MTVEWESPAALPLYAGRRETNSVSRSSEPYSFSGEALERACSRPVEQQACAVSPALRSFHWPDSMHFSTSLIKQAASLRGAAAAAGAPRHRQSGIKTS